MTKAGSSEMHSREDSVLHRWSTEGLLRLPDMRAHPERTWATSQREPQQWGESPGPALLLSGTRSLIIPWTVERSSLDQDHHQWESTWFTWLSEKHLLSHTQVLRNKHITCHREGFLGGSVGKEFACNAGDRLQCRRPPAMQETWFWSLGREDLLEKEMATHSSIIAWRIPWTGEAGGRWSVGSQSRTWFSN